jgi:hypothetical protein
MIYAIDEAAFEADANQLLKRHVRPLRIRDCGFRLIKLIRAERHIRLEPDPTSHGERGALSR